MSKAVEFDIEERLIDFAVRVIKLTEALPSIVIGYFLFDILRFM